MFEKSGLERFAIRWTISGVREVSGAFEAHQELIWAFAINFPTDKQLSFAIGKVDVSTCA